MGLQIRTYVNGNQEFIDLYPDEDIDLEISFAEIQDITRKNSSYSKEFKVPGSNNNNYIFNYFFDLNQSFTNWNPKKKFEADLLYDGYEIYNGYVRMNSVSINKIEKVYSITFYSAVGDLVANIGDKALCNVDTSSLNHSLYNPSIAEFLFYDPSLHNPYSLTGLTLSFPVEFNPISEGKVQYVLGQRGYDYSGSTFRDIRDINTANTPVLEFSGVSGFFDFSGTPLISSYLIPSVRTRTLYELIVNQSGYFIESDFFQSDYFGRYYIPLSFNTEQPFMAQASPYEYKWVNTTGETNSYLRQVENIQTSATSNVNWFKTRNITRENLGFNPLSFSAYSATTLTQSELDYMFALPQSNGVPYTFQITINCVATGTYGIPPFLYTGGVVELWKYQQNTTPLLAELIVSQNYIIQTQFAGQQTSYTFTGQTTSSGFIFGVDLFFLSFVKGVPPHNVVGATFEIIDSPVVLPYTIELYKEMSCDQKQIDFIQNINRTFNLVVVEHPFKPKTVIIEPMINYIGKGETLDWTDKVNYDAIQNVYPTTNIINGSLFLANKSDKDYINTEFTKRSNKIFGENIIDLDIDYKNKTTNLVQSLGQNTDYYLNAPGDVDVALPCYFITKENNNNGISTFEYRPFRSIPRQTFMSVSISTGNTFTNPFFYRYAGTNIPFTIQGLKSMGTFPNYNRLTTYPFALEDFSHYTIYDSSTTFTEDELVYPEVENMYDRYYRDYITDLISDENKIYQVQMYLTPWEVSNLYFNETIVIKNSKFRINRISNLSLLEPGLCSVELVKLTKDYNPSPIRFYDLINCSDPCDIIHTHTDIMYPIWAFEGQYVDIFKGSIPQDPYKYVVKYFVVRTEYNPNYTYEVPYFDIHQSQTDDYYINWDYACYMSCADTEPHFELQVKNEFENPYTGDCLTMLVTNTGSTSNTFSFKYCDGTIGIASLDPLSSMTVCGLYSSFQDTGFTYCLNSFNPCSSTPLPTPTPTATPNFTPSITPSPTQTPNLSPSQTGTPTPTPTNRNCRLNVVINITQIGWYKYVRCDGTTIYRYASSVGNTTITDCILDGSLFPGIPYSQLAVWTVVSNGMSC